MATMIAAVMHAVDVVQRTVGVDVLASVAALAIIVLFLYVEGRPRSRHSH
ncbi:MAG TPA: hypothetical protein VME47_24440 [Acetobacteraceae bacterium]|nr:hypothetical protein [Acetobacteraceae bacterium]